MYALCVRVRWQQGTELRTSHYNKYSITIYDEASVVTDCTYYIVYHIVLLYKLWLLCDSNEAQASQLL